MMGRRVMLPGLLLGALGCGERAQPAPPAATGAPVNLAAVDSLTVTLPVTLRGQLYVEHDAIVHTRATGVVESIYTDVGRAVRVGDTLVRLESTDQEIALDEAEANFANAKRTLERLEALADGHLVSPADSERAALAYRLADVARRRARRAFEFTRVLAPFDGMVTQRQVRPGRLVQDGDTLLRVSAMGPLLVALQVPEQAAQGMAPGAAAEVRALDGTRVAARVARASPAIAAASGTREIVLQLAGRSGLRPGAGVEVRLGTQSRRVLAVPAAAVAEGDHVLVWEDGHPVLRRVTVGAALADGMVEVVQGLAPGERVVIP
jgi:RND family efflux transporter MFP subunit